MKISGNVLLNKACLWLKYQTNRIKRWRDMSILRFKMLDLDK